MKLVLGSAQFGLDYGITNSSGQVSKTDVLEILKQAKASGVSLIDTAAAYGDSEQTLGDICSEIGGFDFISKVQLDLDGAPQDISAIVEDSLSRLRTEKLYGLMVHNADALLDKRAAEHWDELIKLKQQGKIGKIGVSVYSPEQADKLSSLYDIEIMQIPLNLFDQRFLRANILEELKQKNIELHARSLFLQGLLLADRQNINDYFLPIQSKFQKLEELCIKSKCTKIELVFLFLKSISEIDAFVFGVVHPEELQEILQTQGVSRLEMEGFDFGHLSVEAECFINPSKWNLDQEK